MMAMNSTTVKVAVLSATLALGGLLVPTAAAQSDDEARARELIAKIKKEMRKIDELLLQIDSADPAEARETLETVQADIEQLLDAKSLLEGVTKSQSEVIDGIEELARMTKYKPSNQSDPNPQDDPQQQQQQNQQRQRDRDPKDLKYQGEKKPQPKPQNPNQKQDQPQDGREDKSEPEQKEGGQRPPSETGRFEKEDVSGRWGNLPPKVAEMFQNLGPDAFPPKYRKLLDEYYTKANKKKD